MNAQHHHHVASSAAQPENEQEEAYEMDDVSEKASTNSHQRPQVRQKDTGADKLGAGAPLEPVKSKASVNNVSAIPNGGLKAWLQVLGAFFLLFNTWGVVNTFGAYQTYYESGELFVSNSSDISWIGSIQAFCLLFVGALTGPVYDAGHFKTLTIVGAFLVVFGQMMTSLCHTYWQVILAQAITIGLGCGCLFVPSVALVSTYFTTKVALALGIVASGSSLGGVIYPIVFHKLQPRIGFGWATRVIGFIELATLLISIAVMRVRVLPASTRKLIDWSALRDLSWVAFVIGGFMGFMGIYVPFFYIQYFAITTHLTDENLGFYLLAILNSLSAFGRILPNLVADKVGPLNMLIPFALLTGVLSLCLIGVHNEGGVIVIAALYGFTSGCFVSLPPAVFVELSPNRGLIGTRMGMGFGIVAFGVLIGSPISGAVLDADGFHGLWGFGGAFPVAAGLIWFLSKMAHGKWNIMAKV